MPTAFAFTQYLLLFDFMIALFLFAGNFTKKRAKSVLCACDTD